MKILCLPLKSKWYDMIDSGVKKEEYREIGLYWISRMFLSGDWIYLKQVFEQVFVKDTPQFKEKIVERVKKVAGIKYELRWRDYTHVKFSYGYTKRTMIFEVESIVIGKGNPDWGAEPDKDYFVIKLGKRI